MSCCSDRTMMWKITLLCLAAMLAVGLGQDRPGGAIDINSDDPNFQRAMGVAIKEYNLHSDHDHYYGLATVFRSQSQVVAGVNYIMTLILGKTQCSKYSDGNNCPVITDPAQAEFLVCIFTVFWGLNDDISLSESRCRK